MSVTHRESSIPDHSKLMCIHELNNIWQYSFVLLVRKKIIFNFFQTFLYYKNAYKYFLFRNENRLILS